MNRRNLVDFLLDGIQSQLNPDSFCREARLLLRGSVAKQDIIQPNAIKKSGGRWGLLYGARIRFQCLEEIIYGEEALGSMSGTYGGLAHLIAGVGYFDWTISESAELPAATAAMVENVKLVALPFFEEYKKPEDLLCVMKGDGKLLGLSPEDMVVYEAAILWYLDDRERALNTLKCALRERQNELPKKRIQIEHLLARLS